MDKAEMVMKLERHANILRTVRLMALTKPLSSDESAMMDAAIADMDAIAEELLVEVR